MKKIGNVNLEVQGLSLIDPDDDSYLLELNATMRNWESVQTNSFTASSDFTTFEFPEISGEHW